MCKLSSVSSTVATKLLQKVDSIVPRVHTERMDTRQLLSQLNGLITQIEQIKADINSKYETPEMIEARKKSEKGLCCYCGEPHGDDRILRGDHQRCHKKIQRAVASKEITDEQAIRRGWILPPDPGGRKVDPDDPIGRFLAEKEATPKARKKRQ